MPDDANVPRGDRIESVLLELEPGAAARAGVDVGPVLPVGGREDVEPERSPVALVPRERHSIDVRGLAHVVLHHWPTPGAEKNVVRSPSIVCSGG